MRISILNKPRENCSDPIRECCILFVMDICITSTVSAYLNNMYLCISDAYISKLSIIIWSLNRLKNC